MSEENAIDILIRQLQDETPNGGGYYHFTKLDVQVEGNDTKEALIKYLEQIDAHKNPYMTVTDRQGEKVVLVEDRDLNNLDLEPIADLKTTIDQKLEYWSNHQTSLDCRDAITDNYPKILDGFNQVFWSFLNPEG